MTPSALRAAVRLGALAVLASLSLDWALLDDAQLVDGWAIVPVSPVALAVGAGVVGLALLVGTAALAGGRVARVVGPLAGVAGLLLAVAATGSGPGAGPLLAAAGCLAGAVACDRLRRHAARAATV